MFEHLKYSVCALVVLATWIRTGGIGLDHGRSQNALQMLALFFHLLLFVFLVADATCIRKLFLVFILRNIEVFKKSDDDEQIENEQRSFYSILIHTKPSVKKEFALTVGGIFFIILNRV